MGDEKPTFVDTERDTGRSEDVNGVGGYEIGYASIDEEAGVINKSGYPPPRGEATTSLVLDPEGEVILKSRLKANGVQEGAEGVFLLAPSGHVGNELRGRRRHTGTNGATLGVTQPDQSR